MEQKEIRMKKVKSAVDGIIDILFFAVESIHAVSELQGYLEYSLSKFDLPKTREEEIKEVEKFIEQVNPIKNEYKKVAEEIKSGSENYAKFLRESGVERKINFLIFIGLLHHQEDFLKSLGACDIFFKSKISNSLTLGKLLESKQKNSINRAFRFKNELLEQPFYQNLKECNAFCNLIKHNEKGTLERFEKINETLTYKFTHNVHEMESRELILSSRFFLRYIESFKNLWIYIYSKIDERLTDHKEKIDCEKNNGFSELNDFNYFNDIDDIDNFLEGIVKIVEKLKDMFSQAKNNLEESIEKQMPR